MNVVLPEKPKIINRRNVTYLTILIVCAVAVAIAVYQFFSEEKLGVIIGITNENNEEINELKADFVNLFTCDLKKSQNDVKENVTKKEQDKQLVYTDYELEEESVNNYELNVKIPCINIDDKTIQQYNDEIKKDFQNPAEDVKQTENRNIVYTVRYFANIENNILTVSILSTFKEGNGVQRTISNTYNYNLETNKEVTLDDFMQIKNTNKESLESQIESEIKSSQEQAEQLKELGYDIFSRDITDERYNIENTNNYFIYDGYLYIIYAYGNSNNTSEMDIVII